MHTPPHLVHHTDRDELEAWLRLVLTPGLGPASARHLLAAFGSAQAVFAQPAQVLADIGTDRLSAALVKPPPALAAQLQATLDWLAAGDDRRVATLGDAHYPADLLNIEDPPLMLYELGTLASRPHALSDVPPVCLAIVGSRNPTPQGAVNARQFARALGGAGLCVVSGLAMGVDGEAHEGALEGGGATIAVVGTGLDRVYPKQHLDLARRIAQQGMLVSEFPLGTPPLTANFPRRNRIISGLSRGTLVIEAALKSGSLITARLAAEQGKEVFAIPGSIHSPQSRGCHALIRQGAKLVETAQDVLEELQLPIVAHASGSVRGNREGRGQNEPAPDDPASNSLLAALGFDVCSLDALQARTGLPTPLLQARLLELELQGNIARLPGGRFQRVAGA
ncbi:MAG: DNA-processing protein DprA [Polaromonas sp.]|nr:DNA-processing protein DprA [Polaromonas sp.]